MQYWQKAWRINAWMQNKTTETTTPANINSLKYFNKPKSKRIIKVRKKRLPIRAIGMPAIVEN